MLGFHNPLSSNETGTMDRKLYRKMSDLMYDASWAKHWYRDKEALNILIEAASLVPE